jgi:adenylate cyclase
MSGITQYEVQVQQNGRWSIHAQFGPMQKDRAVEEAKGLEAIPSITAVKVIRDFYDPTKGVSREFVVYKSSGLKMGGGAEEARPAGSPAAAASGSSWLEDGDENDDEGAGRSRRMQRRAKPVKRKQKGSSLSRVVIKLLFVALFSIALAAFFTFVTSALISGKTLFGYRIFGNLESNVLFVVFVATFLVAASLMAMGTLKKDTLAAPNLQRRAPVRAALARHKPAEKRVKKTAPEPAGDEAKKVQEKLTEAAQEARQRADEEANERLRAEIGQDQQGNDAAAQGEAAGDEMQKRGVVLDAETYGGDSGRNQPPLSPHAEKQKAFMMQALKTALTNSPSAQKKLDNFNKFGVNLWLAGASEVLAQKRNLDDHSHNRILSDSVQVMGFKRSHAASFSERYEEYLLQDARYMQMFQAGRNAMNTFLAEPNNIGSDLEAALTDWNQPKQKEQKPRVVSVLFTDIAGSTAMTQQLGDAGAQEVVRAHNRIVREALTQCHGREVKHTGDGIMASFDQASEAVEAAIAMQRGAERHTAATPNLPLHLKIGINAGEPIQEDNDLFGTTVQLSARIVDKAKADQIFVSEVVRGICSGKSYQFQNRGGYEMKGFSEPVTLYEVVWSQAAAAE